MIQLSRTFNNYPMPSIIPQQLLLQSYSKTSNLLILPHPSTGSVLVRFTYRASM